MADIMPLNYQADYSDERRQTALSWIRGEGLLESAASNESKLVAAVGLLICDDLGRVTMPALESALRDPSVVQAATNLLREAAH